MKKVQIVAMRNYQDTLEAFISKENCQNISGRELVS